MLGLYAAAFSLPSAVLGSSALGNEGGFPELLAPILFGFVALFDVYLIVSALRLGRRYAPIGVATVIVGSLVGLAYLIYQRRGKADLWGYYPEKFTWLVLVMLVPITIGLLVALLSERPPQGRAQRTALGAVVVAAVLAALVASGISAPERISPVIGIVGGRVFGITNAQAEAVFTRGRRLEGRARRCSILRTTAVGGCVRSVPHIHLFPRGRVPLDGALDVRRRCSLPAGFPDR